MPLVLDMLQVLFRFQSEASISGSWISLHVEFKMAAVASDAASMLAEALQKMDGLISDDQLIMESLKSQPHACTVNERVLAMAEELRAQLEELSRDTKISTIEVPESTVSFLIDWLESVQVNSSKYVA